MVEYISRLKVSLVFNQFEIARKNHLFDVHDLFGGGWMNGRPTSLFCIVCSSTS